MTDSRVMRHLALVALVLIGIFIYAGFRIRRLTQKKTGSVVAETEHSSTKPPADDANSHLTIAEPARPAPVPKPDAVPAPALPLMQENPAKPKDTIKPPPLPSSPSLPQQPIKNSNNLGGKTPSEKIKPRVPSQPVQTAQPPLPPVIPKPKNGKPHRKQLPSVKREHTQSGRPQTGHTPSIDIEADGAVYSMYKVKPGDTLSGIARKLLGSSAQARKIFANNRDILADSDHLSVGMRLRIPGWKGQQQNFGTAKTLPKTIVKSTGLTHIQTYKVKPGDTLCGLAFRFYGTSSAWHKIHDANRAQIPNPNCLRVGAKLVIPGKE